MQFEQFRELIERYISGQCTEAEKQQLKTMMEDPAYAGRLEQIMDGQLEESTLTADDLPGVTARIRENVLQQIAGPESMPKRRKPVYRMQFVKWAAAVVLPGLISAAVFRYIVKKEDGQKDNGPIATTIPATIAPGKDGAILELADGSTIVLDSLGNGIITIQNGSSVLLENGKLVYKNKDANDGPVAYNTIRTPKGRQFQLQLEDGTRVWLNAASSLRYPAVFTGNERKVEITGEAYFEVAKDKQRKFSVQVGPAMTVEVLGTHFNINSYENESAVRTTLLEGSVKVIAHEKEMTIKPGQQASLINQGLQLSTGVDLQKVMAWKNGQFDFNNASLQEIMRQLERWYDIEVEYAPGVKSYEFFGKMDRSLSLQDVLRGLAMSEVKFEFTGDRKIIVKP